MSSKIEWVNIADAGWREVVNEILAMGDFIGSITVGTEIGIVYKGKTKGKKDKKPKTKPRNGTSTIRRKKASRRSK
jgi:hypothetical protein